MRKKIFFIDLDGTTLKDDKSIPEENIEAIRETADAGHYVAIATGRALSSAYQVAKNLGMMRKGCFLISFNGAIIYDLSDMSLLQNLRLDDACAAYLFDEAKKCGLYMQAYSEKNIRTPRECRELFFYTKRTGMDYELEPDLYEREIYNTPKAILISENDREVLLKFQAMHREWESGRCISFFSCPELLEYCPIGGTKDASIFFMEKRLDIAHENTIAIGDEENDLAMIKAAGVGVAMNNAIEKLKDCADYVTVRDNNHGGVAEVLRRFS